MARNHGRIAVTIWQDPDFCALPVGPQRLYLFLTSQPNVSHLGVLPLTIRRWSKAVAGYTTELLEADLDILEDHGFVLVDEDTEEVLVRTLFRHDGVYKQPNVLLSAMSSVKAIASRSIKQTLAVEVEKVPVEELDEAKREVVRGHLLALVEALLKGSPNPSPNPSGTPSDGLGEPPTRVHAQPLPISPTLSPSPESPSDSQRASSADVFGSVRILDEFIDHCGPQPRAVKQKLGEQIGLLLADGISARQVKAALKDWVRRADAGPGLLPHLVPKNVKELPAGREWIRETS
jgi:hypothetical protein